MKSDTDIWLERISTLHRSLIRKAVAAEGLQLVHFEIMQYLSICNRYSNTAQALTEYLGQTKGSISQSVKFLEEKGFVVKTPDPDDKRYSRLSLSKEAEVCLKRMNEVVMPKMPEDPENIDVLKEILTKWQRQNNASGFGQCQTCRFNETVNNNRFRCGLTGESLTKADIRRICREHEFA